MEIKTNINKSECWICKRSQDDFKEINSEAISMLTNYISKLTKMKDEIVAMINDKNNITDNKKEIKHLETVKGQLNGKIKSLNILKKKLSGKFYDYDINNIGELNFDLSSSLKKILPESFLKEYLVDEINIDMKIKICSYCKEILDENFGTKLRKIIVYNHLDEKNKSRLAF